MKTRPPFTQAYEQLPDTLPIFPLAGAILFPGGGLPLNIFEPRYLNMVQDAMQTHRLIGMIQPRDQHEGPTLYDVGCAGRITRYLETTDGRLEIVLTGVCRFNIERELETVRGYRLVIPDWSLFASDYEEQTASESAVALLHASLRAYFENHGIDADWNLLDQLDPELQSSTLVGALSIGNDDKQLLLETSNLEERLRAFAALLLEEETTPAQH
jgi:Lon protease-like protein